MFDLNSLIIQTYDDLKSRKDPTLSKIFLYDLDLVEELNLKGAAITFCPNLQELIWDEKKKQYKRGIEVTKSFNAFFLDLDVCKEEEKLSKKEINTRKKELWDKLINLEIPPNYIIETKHGYQPVWEWSKPIELPKDKREDANVYFQRMVKGFESKTGIKSEADSITRVIRLPNTFHQKDPKNPFKIILHEVSPNKVTLLEFIAIYPLPPESTLSKSETYESEDPEINQILNYNVKKALEKLSGSEIVDGEVYTFKQNSNGTIQIFVNGKSTDQWIDPMNNTIGGGGTGRGNPSIIQWVQWYDKSHWRGKFETEEAARAKAIKFLKEILLGVGKKEDEEIRGEDYAQTWRQSKDDKPVIYSGFPKLDSSTGGFELSRTYPVAGLEKSGKSTFLMNMVNNMLLVGIKVGIIDTELGHMDFFRRMAAIYSGLHEKDPKNNRENINTWVGKFIDTGLLSYCEVKDIIFQGVPSIGRVEAKFDLWIKAGVKVLVFDNITTIQNSLVGDLQGWQVLSVFCCELMKYIQARTVVFFPVLHTKSSNLLTSESTEKIKKIMENQNPHEIFEKSVTVNFKPNKSSLYGGSGMLSQITGGILLLWRPYQDFGDPKFQRLSRLILEDFRSKSQNFINEIDFDFDQTQSRYYEFSENNSFESEPPIPTEQDEVKLEKNGEDFVTQLKMDYEKKEELKKLAEWNERAKLSEEGK